MRRAVLCWMVTVFLCMADGWNGRVHIGDCRWGLRYGQYLLEARFNVISRKSV